MQRPWTQEEVDFLTAFSATKTRAEIGKALNRSEKCIKSKLACINNPEACKAHRVKWLTTHPDRRRASRKKWEMKHPEYVKEKRRRHNKREGLTPRKRRHNLLRQKRVNNRTRLTAVQHRQIWTIQDDRYILEHTNDEAKVVAVHLGRTKSAVKNRRHNLRLLS